jgi:hypothetical protein
MTREPHFDADGNFIHPCCICGGGAGFGFGVSLRRGELGTWYCGKCVSQRPGYVPPQAASIERTIDAREGHPPELQRLVLAFTPEAWARFDQAMKNWKATSTTERK